MSITRSESVESISRHKVVWVGVILALLTLQVLMCAAAVYLATTDDRTAIEPDYHEKALRWNEAVAAKQASDALGWKADIAVEPAPDLFGHRSIRVAILDRRGVAVTGAEVRVVLFHHAHGAKVQDIPLVERSDAAGAYAARVPMRQAGLWEFRVTARLGKDVFHRTEQRDVPGH